MEKPGEHMPGEAGVWLLIAGDVIVFSLLFVSYLTGRIENYAEYAASQLHLSTPCGLLNTLIMLFSSWFVAMGIRCARLQQHTRARSFLAMAIGCGLAFSVVKYIEYSAKLGAGMTPTTNEFFMYYFVMTGIHLLHVFIGMAVLAALCRYSFRAHWDEPVMRNFESGASFWHAVDAIWIVLFALLYLVR